MQLVLVILMVCLAGPSWAATRLQAGLTTHDGATNFTHALASNVTAGSLLVVSSARWKSADAAAYVAGNLSKSAGTATIGQPVLEYTASPGSAHRVGQWSVLVTGSGSLTLQVAHTGAAYGSIAVAEYSGTWDATRTEVSNSGTALNAAADSGNVTSAGAAVLVGSLSTDSPANEALTQDAAFALLGEDEAGADRIHHAMIERIVASGTTDSASWTLAEIRTWVAGVVVYREGTGGGGGSTPCAMLMGVGP